MVAAVFVGMRLVWQMKTTRLHGAHVAIAEEAIFCDRNYTLFGGAVHMQRAVLFVPFGMIQRSILPRIIICLE